MKFFKKKEEKLFLGFYGLSTWMTYIGVVAACIGIFFAMEGETTYAIVCLLIAGIADAFDGKIARMCKRSSMEKSFGIQLDSLADMNSFIFLPVAIAYSMGFNEWYHVLIYTLFTLGGIIRLAYFNVLAETPSKDVPKYHGLPVTTTSMILPLVYCFRTVMIASSFMTLYTAIMAFISILFVLNFTFKKPDFKWVYLFIVASIIIISYLLVG